MEDLNATPQYVILLNLYINFLRTDALTAELAGIYKRRGRGVVKAVMADGSQ